MVQVTTSVELEQSSQLCVSLEITRGSCGIGFVEKGIEIVDIGFCVFIVV